MGIEFLFGGGGDSRDKVCLEKEKGGLGIKGLRVLDFGLLGYNCCNIINDLLPQEIVYGEG